MSSSPVIVRKRKSVSRRSAPAAAPAAASKEGGGVAIEWIEEPFTLIKSYFDGQYLDRLVRHQIESYNHFTNFQLNRTIEMFNPIVARSETDFNAETGKYNLEARIYLENFKLYPPQIHENNGATKLMFPQEARLRNFTYASAMTVDVHIKYVLPASGADGQERVVTKVLPKINIGKLPIMLKSSICLLTQNKQMDHSQTGECKYDCGGYFIINGSEKTVLSQERAAENRVYCFCGKNTTKWSWYAEIKSVPDFKCISPKQIEVLIANKNNGFGNPIYVNIPRVKIPIELFIVFRALGVVSDLEICEHILLSMGEPPVAGTDDTKQACMRELLYASIIDANKYMTQEDAIRHITSYVAFVPINMDKEMGAIKKREFTMEILNNDLFPHCHTPKQKIYFLGYMTNMLLQASQGWNPPDDRDSYVNKRIELTGTLLNNLFRNYFNKLAKEVQKQTIREINNSTWRNTNDVENIINMINIYKILKPTTIENGIKRALSTGDFSIKQSSSAKVGVAQVLNRLTYASSLSHLRRVNTPMDKSGELIAPRKLHNTTWGFLCVTGDTEVLMANRIDTKKIRDLKDGDWVTTINRTTLEEEPSPIHSWFCKMPDKLFEITTISGRKIKATADHPFLVAREGGAYEMVKLGELSAGDKLVVRHTVESIPELNTTKVRINDSDVLEHYRVELLEAHLLNRDFSTGELKIIARLIGALNTLNTDGNIGIEKGKDDKEYYRSSFYVGEELDVYQLQDDIKTFGFGYPSISRCITQFVDKTCGRVTSYKTWSISKSGAFAYFMNLMGGFVGRKTNMCRSLPEWLVNAEPSIKREFLSGFQGGDGSKLSYNKNCNKWKPNLGPTSQTTFNTYLEETTQFMNQIVTMFLEFDIKCKLQTSKVDDEKSKVSIMFDITTENIVRYADIVTYAYCEEKRRKSEYVIEHLKIREFNKKEREDKYKYIVEKYGSESIENLIEKTGITKSQIHKIMSKTKKGKSPNTRFVTYISYDDFIRDNGLKNGCIGVPILDIKEVQPELVYDFTTFSENHSFVAASYVISNCSPETPEGASIGLVKNLSYMTHVTILSNSSPLHEYVAPFIERVEDASTSRELYGLVKVFVNGAWLGITRRPFELFRAMKHKKHCGIINIYTSVVFNYKLMEIRICNDGGRLTRPLLRVGDDGAGGLLVTADIIERVEKGELHWNDLLCGENAVIEYIDPEEQNCGVMCALKPADLTSPLLSQNAVRPKYTHCEIHPSTIFGVLASCIPYPEHNQAPRNAYQCLSINETVQMADGTVKEIKDVSIGERVLSFHPETFQISETKVVDHFIRNNEYDMYCVKTLSGREIVATEDHYFMTNQGWKQVHDMIKNPNIKIAILKEFNIEKWCSDMIEEKNGALFVPIENIIKMPDQLISCIETESENHSFITTHGIMSKNCCMSKQSIGIYATNFDQRMDKTAYVLTYPTRPLVETRMMNFIKLNEIPSGAQAIVAIMTHTGYNQEDSILINKGSIDRGMFTATIYHTEKDENKKINGDEQIRCRPDPQKTKGMKFGNYDKVNSQGFIPEDTLVENRDIIISKVLPIKENRNDPTKTIKFEDQSKTYKTAEQTYIDKNYMGRNGDGYNFAKVRTRTFRKPVIGDKFASRSAQKGTIGNIIPEEDMPFIGNTGVRPDIILNPHCFVGESLVSLPHGLSRRLDSFSSEGFEKVFSFSQNGILRSESLGLEEKGIRKTIKLTFIDGREIICTPDHKIRVLTLDGGNEWKEAGKLRPEDKILMGPRGTEDVCYPDEDDWSLEMCSENNKLCFHMKTTTERQRALAFARILGYMLTDGTLCKTTTKGYECYNSNVNMGSITDAENMLDDIHFVTGKRPKILNCHSESNKSDVFVITIPAILSRGMSTLENITIGRRTSQTANYPKFLETAPRAFVREFLAATFGGDGWAPHFNRGQKNTFSCIKFSQSINVEFIESLEEKMRVLVNLMKKVDVDANIVRSRLYNENTKVSVELEVTSNAQFLKNIGFRHCVQKLLRLEIAASYENFCDQVKLQNKTILDRVKELAVKSPVKNNKVVNALTQSREELYKNKETYFNVPLNSYYSELTLTLIANRFKKNRSESCKIFDYKYMTTAEEYLKMCGVENWFDKGTYIVKRDDTSLPFYMSSLMKMEDAGEKNVFDIGVSVLNSFMVSGVCVSNCIPSRMTIAQLKETLICKALVELGLFGDGTAFNDLDIKENICKIVQDCGYEAYGNEVMYNGLTGEQLDANIFIGPCFYQRLKHMVNDKVHSRATGPMVILNRQPTEGRSKGGGLRLGEMERDCLSSGGYSAFLRERFYDAADKYSMHVCRKCGLVAAYNDKYNIHWCKTCDNRADFAYVEVPYAFKLLSQELQTINVVPRLITE